jgi:hypothetical protein
MMKIQINAVSGITSKPGKFKPYLQYDIEFIDMDSGRPRKKHMVDFNGPKAFEALKEAQVGQCFEIEEKPGKDPQYTDWVDATPITVETPVEAPKGMAAAQAAAHGERTTTTFKSTYETPEERARKQVYIVRQSNIKDAIALLSLQDIGRNATTGDVLEVAKQFEAYVFGTGQYPAAGGPTDVVPTVD